MSDIAPICELANIGEWRMRRKTELILTGKKISEIPDALGNVTNLQVIKFAENELSQIPATIGSLTNLSVLVFQGNKLIDLPETISLLTRLIHVDLSKNQFSVIPFCLLSLGGIQVVRLSANKISEIPRTLDRWSKLVSLTLDQNEINDIPDELYYNTTIEELSLAQNKIFYTTKQLQRLYKLQKLNLSFNQLVAFPDAIQHLSNITELNLSNNQIIDIPFFMSNHVSLRNVNLSKNEISFVPEFLGFATKLVVLDLSENKTDSIPDSMLSLTCYKKNRALRRMTARTATIDDIIIYGREDRWEDVQRLSLVANIGEGSAGLRKLLSIVHLEERLKVCKGISDTFMLETGESQRLMAEAHLSFRTAVQEVEKSGPILTDLRRELKENEVATDTAVARKRQTEIAARTAQTDRARFAGLTQSAQTLVSSVQSRDLRIQGRLAGRNVGADVFTPDAVAETLQAICLPEPIPSATLLTHRIDGPACVRLDDPLVLELLMTPVGFAGQSQSQPQPQSQSAQTKASTLPFGSCIRLAYLAQCFREPETLNRLIPLTRLGMATIQAGSLQPSSSAQPTPASWNLQAVVDWLVICDLTHWVPFFVANRLSGPLLPFFHSLLTNEERPFSWDQCPLPSITEDDKARLLQSLAALDLSAASASASSFA